MSFRFPVKFLAAVLGLLFCSGAGAAPIELKFGHIGGPGSLYYVSAEEFARRVNAKLKGIAHVSVVPESKLGDDTTLLKKVHAGEVAFSLSGTVMSSVADEFGVFELPFLIHNREHVKRFRRKILSDYLNPAVRAKGYVILGMWELGFRQITNNVRPVEGPDSLKGMRLRIPKGKWRQKMFEAYGVKTEPMELKEVYGALDTGKLDGLETPLDLIYSLNIQRVQKYATLTYHLYSPAFLITGAESFARLPPKVQKTIIQVASEMQDWTLKKASEIDADLLVKFKPYCKINEADRFAFTLQSLPIYNEFLKEVPAARAMVKLIFQSDPHPFAALQ